MSWSYLGKKNLDCFLPNPDFLFSLLFFSFLLFFFSFAKLPASAVGGSFSQKRSPRAAKLVLNRTGSYLRFPVVPAGWAGGRSRADLSQSSGGTSLPCSLPPLERPSTACLFLNWDPLE